MSKYGNRKVTLDGIQFDSIREAKRWRELKWLEKAGETEEPEQSPDCSAGRGKGE